MTTSEPPPAGGHPSWLVELFQANVGAAFNVAYRLVWNRADAQDVVQTSFIKATRNVSQLRDASKARGWLLSITYREALMVLRSRRDLSIDPFAIPERVDHQPGPEDHLLQHELACEIRTAIDHLPELLRTAFVLRDVEELPMTEVAEVLDIGPSAAKMRVARARELLRISLTGRI